MFSANFKGVVQKPLFQGMLSGMQNQFCATNNIALEKACFVMELVKW